jgi:leucyl-tRNA synthetase
MGPFEQAIAWNTAGISGTKKFLDKVQNLLGKIHNLSSGVYPAPSGAKEVSNERKTEDSKETLILLHQSIKKLTENIDEFKFNTAISQLMILTNHLTDN